jgi:predicted nuclease of predicted toxin-antitoxin system
MKLLADLHISPSTVKFLRSLGHDVVRVNETLPFDASDEEIISKAISDSRTILTQDLDFSALIVLSAKEAPSLISLRLQSSRPEHVNSVLARALPMIAEELKSGIIATIEDYRIRRKKLRAN